MSAEKKAKQTFKFDTKCVIRHPVEMTWSAQKTPIARDGHGAVIFGNSMYIFGGNSEIGPLKDLWRFDFTKKIWIRLEDTPCSGRYSFSMHLWQEKFIVLFGGCSAVTSPSNSKRSNSMTVLKDLLIMILPRTNGECFQKMVFGQMQGTILLWFKILDDKKLTFHHFYVQLEFMYLFNGLKIR